MAISERNWILNFSLVVAYLLLCVYFGLHRLHGPAWAWVYVLVLLLAAGAAAALPGAGHKRHGDAEVERRSDGSAHFLWWICFSIFPVFLISFYAVFWPMISARNLFIATLVLIVAFSVVARRIRPSERQVAWLVTWSVPVFLMLLFSDGDQLIRAANDWRVMAEEGQVLAIATQLKLGALPYRDIIMPRSPLIFYTTLGALQVLGDHVISRRAWIFILKLLMGLCNFYFCRALFQSRFLRFSALLILFIIGDFNYRVGFALLSIGMFLSALKSRNHRLAAGAGLVAGVSVLASQEVALSSIAAIGVTGILALLFFRNDRRDHAVLGIWYVGGLLVFLLPLVAICWWMGFLPDVIRGMWTYPKYYADMGFFSLPYPSLLNELRKDAPLTAARVFWLLRLSVTWYMPIAVYLFGFFLSMRAIVLKQKAYGVIALLIVNFFGWFTFRSALGRSDMIHLYFCVSPAFLLPLMYAERIKGSRRWMDLLPAARPAPVIFALMIPILFIGYRARDQFFPLASALKENLGPRPKPDPILVSYTIPKLNGILAPPKQRDSIESTVRWVGNHLRPGDRVYAFPANPIYYFLLDTRNPTRYTWAFHAITSDMRQDAVESLQATPARFIIFSSRQRLDRIPLEESLPEIMEYFQNRYRLLLSYGDEQIWVPISPRRLKKTEAEGQP